MRAGTWWMFALVYFLVHAIVATCLPERLAPASTLCIVIAEWAVALSAFRFSRQIKTPVRILWWLLACSSVLESLAMCADMATEISGIPVFNYVPAISILFSMLCGVPLLAAVSIQFDRRILIAARNTATALSGAIGVLLYLQIFSHLSVHGSTNLGDALFVSRVFDAIDVYLALAATIRWFGANDAEESIFFRAASIFLWLNAIFPALHNRILIRHDYIWLDLFLSAPYAILFVLIGTARRASPRTPRPEIVHFVESGSPIFLSLALLVLAMVTARTHFYIGLGAALLAFTGYGVSSVLAQGRARMAEEALLGSKNALEELVGVDSLTGIANRWAFDEALRRECARTRRTGIPLSLLMIDVDHFKLYNDTNGHPAGDACLAQIASALQAALPRSTDFVARYGGEEFTVILPGTYPAGAAEVSERLCRAIADLRLPHTASDLGVVTISVGLSTYDGSENGSPAKLVDAADRGLYNAKRLGRNRCEWFSMETVETGEPGSVTAPTSDRSSSVLR